MKKDRATDSNVDYNNRTGKKLKLLEIRARSRTFLIEEEYGYLSGDRWGRLHRLPRS